ncbi:MAG TPA: glycoside hydrolase family 5 protein, partial [Trueperaceae bacterium]|nr:glycoside hydrolase family 5 protein [Trueperaceae bacterium]
FNIAQAVINGIRSNDTKTAIVVGGDSWSSAERWQEESDNLKNLIDPNDNLIFEAHVYFDKDASGQYLGSYDDEEASPNTGIERVQPFINWLKNNNKRGFIGEYGVPSDDDRWKVTLDNFLNHLAKNCLSGSYWAAGPWWGDYPLTLEIKDDGADQNQMEIVKKYSKVADSCSY